MDDDKLQQLSDRLSSLVARLVPGFEDEDDAVVDERHEAAVNLAKQIIEEQGSSSKVTDVQHAADLIKKKLLREHSSPDKAVRFSNLYTRLLSQPVLTRKWEILYLLHQLSSSQRTIPGIDVEEDSHVGPSRLPDQQFDGLAEPQDAPDDQTYRDAFATSGLERIPTDAEIKKSAGFHKPPTPMADSDPVVTVRPMASNEVSLLRDLPFTLQGLSTSALPFSSSNTLDFPPSLPLPIISLLHSLAEPSLLYRSLTDFVQSKDEGLVGQSLRSAIQDELRSYLNLISSLETQIRLAIPALEASQSCTHVGKVGVTLKRCVVWTRDATMALRLMSVMAEEAKTKKGGQLISMIHSFSATHGDRFVQAFAERLLSHVTRPFYDILRRWIYDGELSDPYGEFFVIENGVHALVEDPRKAATSVWEEKYQLDKTMVPTIITEDFARKVFLIGKSLNFIRHSCGDSNWVEAHCKTSSRELKYGDTATLETSIDQAYKTTMGRLIQLMNERFQLSEHLSALKRYLLLGQGDFIALLMESLSANLDRPAGSQYRHTLTAQLEHAIRGSNAQFDPPEILRRLDARLTEMEKGDTGWDVFTLEYKVDAPVDVVITPWANRQYLKVFNLLWRIKRVEFALGSTWRRSITGARGVLTAVDSQTTTDWKNARCAIAEMIHFVNQLQYYVLFEVIEASWDALQAAMSKPDCTLDDLISAHNKYLRAITHKGLLGSVRTNSSGHKEDVFTAQLHEILKTMLGYKEAVDGLYSYSVAEFTRKQQLAAKIETRTAQGKWGFSEKDEEASSPLMPTSGKQRHDYSSPSADSPFPIADNPLQALSLPSDEESLLPALRKRLGSLATDFKSRINTLLGDLAVQPDVDMKFLAVVMNFNDVYQPKRRRRPGHNPAGTATTAKTPALAQQQAGSENEGGKRKRDEHVR